ncbi:ABC transporter ATP-binding protein [Micromonospora sp. NPDC005087]|uniref:ABC transporter ATP-binding protein n=1 Tax=Micromonospora sp. NPDC005087 TaxID=3364225 RepID=UPI00368E2804
MTDPVLDVSGLSVSFRSDGGEVLALDDVSLRVEPGEIVGVVGESGCGKSTLGLSIMGLLPSAAMVRGGNIRLAERDMLTLPAATLRRVRGSEVGMIFQEPMTSLNPVMAVGRQISEVLRRHRHMSRHAAAARAIELLELVGIPDAARRSRAYPHQLSGGMRQRVMIAIAVACEPKLLIADEPTTALDVTVQAQILDLLRSLRDRIDLAILLITHNLGVIATMADRVAIMYAGRKVEEGRTRDILDTPRHPYTARLLASTPRSSRPVLATTAGRTGDPATTERRLAEIPGRVPMLTEPATTCTFAPRCHRQLDRCTQQRPELESVASNQIACFNPEALW